jgi:hypothetical protein
MSLTERDVSILLSVYTHGFLTTDLIELAFFPAPRSGRRAPSTRCYDRLRLLWLWGWLERVEPPTQRVFGGRRPFLYTLGKRGMPVVARRLAQERAPVQRRRLDRLDDLFIDHDLTIAAFWAHLMALARSGQLRVRWTPERELRAMGIRVQDAADGQSLPFLPDAYLEVIDAGGQSQSFVLEVDMGSLTRERFRRKIRAFEAALDQHVFQRIWRHGSFEVVVLTHSVSRLINLVEAAQRDVARERWPTYRFGTFELLDEARFGSEGWLTLDRRRGSLISLNPRGAT